MDPPSRTYVALLRAVNVGGTSIIKMPDLRQLFEAAGFEGVATYVASGNVLFATKEADASKVAARIEDRLATRLGRPCKAFVLAPRELEQAAHHNPFEPARHEAALRCQLMFLDGAPEPARRRDLEGMAAPEYRVHVHGRVLYYAYPRVIQGRRRTIDFEKVLGVCGTARTWKVVDKLIELAGARSQAPG
jgi:uncharacterized protein (DUF1697 family)